MDRSKYYTLFGYSADVQCIYAKKSKFCETIQCEMFSSKCQFLFNFTDANGTDFEM